MSYHEHRPSHGEPRRPKDDSPHDRLFYVYLLGAAAFVLMVWTAVAFERNRRTPPAPKPLAPVIVKMPERAPSIQVEKINTPDPSETAKPPALTTDAGAVLDLHPSVDLPAEPQANAPQPEESANAEAVPAEQPVIEAVAPLPAVDRPSRNHHRRHRHHGGRRVFHHWPSHRHAMRGCEPLCELFKGTARAAGLIP